MSAHRMLPSGWVIARRAQVGYCERVEVCACTRCLRGGSPMKRDERHEPMPVPERETLGQVLDAVCRVLARQRDGEPADRVESGDLLKRVRRARG